MFGMPATSAALALHEVQQAASLLCVDSVKYVLDRKLCMIFLKQQHASVCTLQRDQIDAEYAYPEFFCLDGLQAHSSPVPCGRCLHCSLRRSCCCKPMLPMHTSQKPLGFCALTRSLYCKDNLQLLLLLQACYSLRGFPAPSPDIHQVHQ